MPFGENSQRHDSATQTKTPNSSILTPPAVRILQTGGSMVIESTTPNWKGPGHPVVYREDGQDHLPFQAYDEQHGTPHAPFGVRRLDCALKPFHLTSIMSTDHHAQLCHLAGKAVADFDMIHEGDRLLVGISGGVDSMMLMHVLDRLRQRAPVRFELFAVTIDEGFEGIHHAGLADYAAEQEWELKIIKTPIAQLIAEKESGSKPCGLCSRLRRGFIHGYADELGCSKLVLGHHRDDLCVSLLMGLFRGTGLKTMGPNVAADHGTKRIIRPFCYASKDLIETCAKRFEFPDVGSCDYTDHLSKTGDRAYLERLLSRLAEQFPNLGKNMLHSMADLRPDYLLDKRYWS